MTPEDRETIFSYATTVYLNTIASILVLITGYGMFTWYCFKFFTRRSQYSNISRYICSGNLYCYLHAIVRDVLNGATLTFVKFLQSQILDPVTNHTSCLLDYGVYCFDLGCRCNWGILTFTGPDKFCWNKIRDILREITVDNIKITWVE